MGKNLPAKQETGVQFLGQEDSLEGGNGKPLQYPCLEKSMDRGAWPAVVNGVTRIERPTPLNCYYIKLPPY